MITVKKDENSLRINFSSTMFFEEIMKCPSELRREFIHHIEEKDDEWLFRFCIKHFGDKVFYYEGKK